jgi:hypothetical protein
MAKIKPGKALKLNVAWNCGALFMKPGIYNIPAQISGTLAKCAVADHVGEIVEAATFRAAAATAGDAEKPARTARRKSAAPENKGRGAASENK